MADFTHSKSYGTAMYPVHARETNGVLKRCEPMLSPAQLISRFLKGIPLMFPNGDTFSDEELLDRINLAVNESEILLGCPIVRTAFQEKRDFDWNLYKQFMHMRTEEGPVVSIESLAITTSDRQTIFEVPAQWVETANFSKNLINVIPLLAAFGATSASGSPISATNQGAGIAFLAIWGAMGGVSNIPAYWEIKYTAGLSNKEGQVPVIVNKLIGTVAALDILSSIAPSNIYNSQALSQDGISQSSSGPGPRVYELRRNDLITERDEIVRKLKAIFSSRYFVGNI